MAPIFLAALAWLHIFTAVGWLGSVMTFGMVIGPSLAKMTGPARMDFFIKVGPRFTRFAITFAGMTMIFGVLLAYELAPSLYAPLSYRGVYIGIGAVLALIAFLDGLLEVRPTVLKIGRIGQSLQENPGPPPPELEHLSKRLRIGATTGLVLLVLVLVLMIGSAWT